MMHRLHVTTKSTASLGSFFVRRFTSTIRALCVSWLLRRKGHPAHTALRLEVRHIIAKAVARTPCLEARRCFFTIMRSRTRAANKFVGGFERQIRAIFAAPALRRAIPPSSFLR